MGYLIFVLCVSIALLVVDWLQTRFIAKNPAMFHEINVFLGPHPSVAVVNVYFSTCILIALICAYSLPQWVAMSAGIGLIFMEALVTARNYRLGVGFA